MGILTGLDRTVAVLALTNTDPHRRLPMCRYDDAQAILTEAAATGEWHGQRAGRDVTITVTPGEPAARRYTIVVQDPAATAEPAGATCVKCLAARPAAALETINPAGNLACANTVTCELRSLGLDPADHLVQVARAVARDAALLGTGQLAALITVLKPAVVAFEVELGNNRPREDGDAALAQARHDHAPRTTR
jgi:hypothetical protein